MPKKSTTYPITIPAIGLTKTLSSADYVERYVLISAGAITLTGNVTITPSSASINDCYNIDYYADVDLGTKAISIFGRNLTQEEASSVCKITALYDGSSWLVDVVMSDNATNDSKVKSDATDPTADYLDGKVQNSIVVDISTHAIELDGDDLTPGLNQYYGTDDSGTKGYFDLPLADNIYYKSVTLTHAEILTIYSNPVLLVAAPPTGYGIVKESICDQTKDWTAYTGSTELQVITDTATYPQGTSDVVLKAITDRVQIWDYDKYGGTKAEDDTQVISGKAVYITGVGSDPDYGSGDAANELIIHISYRLIKL